MRKIKIAISNKQLTQFMRHADLFERCKVMLMPLLIATVKDDWNEQNLQALIKACENGPYELVAVFGEKVYYKNPEIKSVSDGECWMTLDGFIASERQ